MWTGLVLLAALQGSLSEADRIRAARAFFETGPGSVPPEGRVEASVGGGTPGAPGGQFLRPTALGWYVPGYPGVYNFTLQTTGSGLQEQLLVQPAVLPPGQTAPLLVIFHGAGTSHFSGLLHTTFFTEAAARGWHVLSPLR
jgi:hypothetical protein